VPEDGRDPVSVEEVTRALDEQTERTLELLSGIDLSQLRATIPVVSRDNPDEVRGLVDTLLSGDLGDDKRLRTLEYLITELSADERAGRRVLVQEPSRVTARLYALSTVRFSADNDADDAVRFMEEAAARVFKEEEIGDIRDSARGYKKQLGSRLLHPRVLTAAISYNVAMWNRVAAEIDSSRSIDELAEGLFVPTPDAAIREESAASTEHLLGTAAFERLVRVVTARVNGESIEDPPAEAVSSRLQLEALRPGDVEVFAGDDATESVWLMRAAITLGLVLEQRPRVDGVLDGLGLDPDQLGQECIEDLIDRMTARARKLMTENLYADAFRLSDVKTHSLAAHASALAAKGKLVGAGELIAAGSTAEGEEAGSSVSAIGQLMNALAPVRWIFGLALLLGVYLLVIGPPGGSVQTSSPAAAAETQVAAINPFLEWGRHVEGEMPPRFVGRVGPTWDWLGTQERREVVRQIGEHFDALGTRRVVLTDQGGQVVARFADGELVDVMAR